MHFEEEKAYIKRISKVLLKWFSLSLGIFSVLMVLASILTMVIGSAVIFLALAIFCFRTFHKLRYYKLKAIIKARKERGSMNSAFDTITTISIEPTIKEDPLQAKPIQTPVATPSPAPKLFSPEPVIREESLQVKPTQTPVATPSPAPKLSSPEPVIREEPLQMKPIQTPVVTPSPASKLSSSIPPVISEPFSPVSKPETTPKAICIPEGNVDATKVFLNANTREQLKQRFIAFDLETTGLDSDYERILEIGATLFLDGKPTDSFQTLVNPERKIPYIATKINHITDEMVADAPTEAEALQSFSDFVGDAFSKGTLFCAHNADFDIRFLKKALQRNGMDADIRYVDTLAISRKYIKGIPNYKLPTVANYFALSIEHAHRADDDAAACGEILCRILNLEEPKKKPAPIVSKAETYSEFELSLLETTKEILKNNQLDFQAIELSKNSTYTDICYKNYNMLRFKTTGKLRYWLLNIEPKKFKKEFSTTIKHTEASKSEGNLYRTRLFIEDAASLSQFESYIISQFESCRQSYESYEHWVSCGKPTSYVIRASIEFDENGKPVPKFEHTQK